MGCTVTSELKQGKRERFRLYGVKPYRVARRCPQCGTKNLYRRPDGVCWVCVMRAKQAG